MISRRSPHALFILTAALSTSAASSDQVDQYIAAQMKRQHIPGLALGVYRRGDIIKAQGYGLANLELDVAVKPETIFQSGSVGKQFTATAIMMLVEEGKVNLDDSIVKYLDNCPAAWQPVKIKNLLSHTSGIAEYETDARIKPGAPFYLRLDNTEDELFTKIAALPMDFQPGEKWRYTNTNYVLLGMLIHKLTGQFYGDFLQDRIFKPLGMKSTRVISEADIIPNRSSGYRLVKGEWKNQEWVSPTFNTTADGALYFNVLDLARWDAALYTERLIKKPSLDRMWTIYPLNNGQPNPGHYGFAWGIDSINGHRVIQHGGAWQGFTTFIARYADDGLTVVVLTNLDAGHARPGLIAHGVAGLYDAALATPKPKPVEDSDPDLTALLRGTLAKIAEGKADPDAFTAEAREELFPEAIEEAGELLKKLGPVGLVELLDRHDENGDRIGRYRLTVRGETLVAVLRVTKERKIAGFDLSPE